MLRENLSIINIIFIYLAEYSFRINRSQNKDTIFNKLMKRIVERSPVSLSQLVGS